MGDIFEMLPELRKLRVFGFNSNDGSECSSGLVFDDNAVEKLLRNQKNFRKIENLELFNTDLTVSLESMTEVLRTLGRLSVDPRILQNSSMSEESLSVNLLFENCHWDSLKELNLLSTIISISSYFSFPILQPNENVLKGDFRFSIYDTNFILKFMI
uniref:FTH domain-containing protein n=1 Tax=Caenorhabditis tropicalis TaxID=1561998 RepID=A0A1I7T0X8_9PELO